MRFLSFVLAALSSLVVAGSVSGSDRYDIRLISNGGGHATHVAGTLNAAAAHGASGFTTTSGLSICPETVAIDDNYDLFARRSFSTPAIPYVPQYPQGYCYGPWCDMDGFNAVDLFGNPYVPTPAPDPNDPASWPENARQQARVMQTLLVREFGGASLVWTESLISSNIGVMNQPKNPVFSAIINETGKYMSNVRIPPTLTTISVGPIVGDTFTGFFDLMVNKAFDPRAAAKIMKRYNCAMPRRAFSSPLCPVVPGFSQARQDWNRFRSSHILALNTGAGTTIESQFQEIMACLDDLLRQASIDFSSTIRVRVTLRDDDEDTENRFRAVWKQYLATAPNGWKPARGMEAGVLLLDPNALLGIAIEEAFIGAPGEQLISSNYPDVFSLPDEYSQVVQTPGGWSYTAQMFGTNSSIGAPLVLKTDAEPFLPYIDELSLMVKLALTVFHPFKKPGYIYAEWCAQQVQVMLNAATVLGLVGVDITDVTYQYNMVGPKGGILPFFAISDASTTIFNNTQGDSGLELPQRDDSVSVALPHYAGYVNGLRSSYHTVFSTMWIALDKQNVRIRAKNNGATPGVSSYSVCDGSTDITVCPKSLTRDLGALGQPVNAN